jgi:hypothetical protein
MNGNNLILNLITLATTALSLNVTTQAQQTPGTWVNVIAPMSDEYASTILVDPARPQDSYVFRENYQGCWRSTDYGATLAKVSAKGGVGGNGITGHGAWYATIDKNPNRDPATAPDIYVTAGYDAMGVWKSTDFGVTWFDVWKDNLYSSDGSANIYTDVGRDVMGIMHVDPTDKNHLIACPHSYWGTGGNNGVFETTDGGGSWRIRKSTYFAFAPHSDMLFALDKNTWCVSHQGTIIRTTDGGINWGPTTGTVAGSTGIQYCNRKVGNTWYVATDHTGSLVKTTDMGASWTTIPGPGNRIEWVLASATTLYVANGYDFDPTDVYSAPIGSDATWTKIASLPKGGHDADMTFDGTHYVIIFPCHFAGVYRYVEPGRNTGIAAANGFADPSGVAVPAAKAMLRMSRNRAVITPPGTATSWILDFFSPGGKRLASVAGSGNKEISIVNNATARGFTVARLTVEGRTVAESVICR